MSPRVLFYVQHLLGIGHLARASRIARALIADGFAVTLVTGGMPVAGFPGPGIPQIELPAIAVSDGAFSGLIDAHGTPVDQAFETHRTALLLAAYHTLKPDIVITEAFPFGRRQVRFELLPLIAAINATTPRPRLIASLRDILQRRAKLGRDAETVALVNADYDLILVHGDQNFAAFADSFPLAHQITKPVTHTGLVCGAKAPPSAEAFDIIVSAGGGAVGAGLVQTAIEAATLMPEVQSWCVITGPNLPQPDFNRLHASAPPNIHLTRFRTDFPNLLASATLSISQAGYNTVGDVLQAGCKMLLVPYAASGETEQTDRALRLQHMGRATILRETDLSGPAMAQAIRHCRAQSPATSAPMPDTNGAHRTATILRNLLAPDTTAPL